ncbi:MAG: tRNA (adenosine(37)-N6)-threonylcarbamoyltransferase complex dimerization subunit type 1 TsaB [Rhizobiales bacterium]|nr:tRNA (adenosine(37)-N6)-threonylcarbamoyltransferase complex dimerization subunit type 1 TsaB [Hyphomicrobiales bacterium]
MNLLAFDTAQGALSVAVVGARPLASRHELRQRGHAENLMPMIAEVMLEAGLGYDDLDALAVTVGPGTFTGLRVGLSAARGIALSRSLPLVGVTTLEAIAEPVMTDPGEVIVSAFDARRGEIYLQVFAPDLTPLMEPMLVALESVQDHLPKERMVGVGSAAALVDDVLRDHHRAFRLADAAAQPDALAVARIAHDRLKLHGAAKFREAPAPLYLRKPDAKLPGGIDPDALPDAP